MTAKQIRDRLNSNGLRSTKDRSRLLAMFGRDRTWTVPELHRRLKTADLSTVYRNVQKLADAGILTVAHLHDRQQHYELAAKPHHAHLICGRCSAAACVPCPVKDIAAEHELEIRGICPACR